MMSRQDRTVSLEEGVYYSRQDYAGVVRRLAIDLIDIIAAFVLWLCLLVVLYTLSPDDDPPPGPGLLLLAVVMLSYFILLKSSPIRTLGYKLCGVNIVNLQGVRPSIPSLALRSMFAVFGPLNFLFDLLWIPSDKHRQALRDKFAHTYVVKAGARPLGRGTLVYSNYFILGWTFIFPEVCPHE